MKSRTLKTIFLLTLLMIASISFAQTKPKVNPTSKTVKVMPNVAPTNLELSTEIKLEDITEWLCPKTLVRGDREFGGNGPKVKSEVKIRLSANGKEVWADIYLWAQETVHDFSTTEARWSKKVYDAPYGKTISKIVSDQASRTEFISPAAGFQFLVPGAVVAAGMQTFFDGQKIANAVLMAHGLPADMTQNAASKLVSKYMKGNTVIKVAALEGTLVKFFHIVGDTGGDDISNDDNCNDDTRIEKIEFFPVKVVFK
ncbi:MAG: hypothetical protein KDD03_03365 [Gelidibacter sp.]|nr:hypothetical protein [Gelidibacter sp.]